MWMQHQRLTLRLGLAALSAISVVLAVLPAPASAAL